MRKLPDITLRPAGEFGLVVELGTVISPAISGLVQQLSRLLTAVGRPGIREIVPAYCSLTVYFDPLAITRQEVSRVIEQLYTGMEACRLADLPARIVYVPVCYGGVLGPDLDFVARYTGVPPREVITLHTSQPYLVYMLGFTPGFPYLGGLPAKLEVPRQETPRSNVPAGSVGIVGNQTGFYPVESPGEWWLIGRTPLQAFDARRPNPFLVSPGDYIQFVAIDMDEYFAIRRQVAAGSYVLAQENCDRGGGQDDYHSGAR